MSAGQDFRSWITSGGAFPPEQDRYHLYISHACPFSARAIISRYLKGLAHAVSMSAVDPRRTETGWGFSHGEYADPLYGSNRLSDLYQMAVPNFHGAVSVPVLWDKQLHRIVSNQSGDIVRMLGSAWDGSGAAPVDLYPEPLRAQIDELNEWIAERINKAVYDVGLAGTQEEYERNCLRLFAALDQMERNLADRRFLLGNRPIESDWRLFATLVRFDSVYVPLFKCARTRLVEMPNLWAYTRDLYQWPGIASTIRHEEIKLHYYTSFPALNPRRIVPLGDAVDFSASHDRACRFI